MFIFRKIFSDDTIPEGTYSNNVLRYIDGTFAETAIVDYRLSFAELGKKKLPISVSVDKQKRKFAVNTLKRQHIYIYIIYIYIQYIYIDIQYVEAANAAPSTGKSAVNSKSVKLHI